MEQAGLVNVARLDSTLRVDLMYARPDNFTGKILYDEAYLQPEAARALVEAQRLLRAIHPDYLPAFGLRRCPSDVHTTDDVGYGRRNAVGKLRLESRQRRRHPQLRLCR